MRVVLGAALLLRANSALWTNPHVTTTIIFAFLTGFGLLLIPGLWTPLVRAHDDGGDRGVTVLLGTIGCVLAMLGPGLWSVDARLFGWKRVEPPPRKINLNF